MNEAFNTKWLWRFATEDDALLLGGGVIASKCSVTKNDQINAFNHLIFTTIEIILGFI